MSSKIFRKSKAQTLSKKTEISLLKAIIDIAVEAENYELAQLVHNRIISVRSDENQSRSYSMNRV